jgi:hypothetical protein
VTFEPLVEMLQREVRQRGTEELRWPTPVSRMIRGMNEADGGLGRAKERDRRKMLRKGRRGCMMGAMKLRRNQSDGDSGVWRLPEIPVRYVTSFVVQPYTDCVDSQAKTVVKQSARVRFHGTCAMCS